MDARFEANLWLKGWGSGPGGLRALPLAPFCDGLLSKEANVFKSPLFAQPGSTNHLEDFLKRCVWINDAGRIGRVLHDFPHMPKVFLQSFWSERL